MANCHQSSGLFWRSDLSKIEVINERQFIEYTKAGIPQHLRLSTKSLSRCIHLRWKTQICEGVGKENSPNQVLRQI